VEHAAARHQARLPPAGLLAPSRRESWTVAEPVSGADAVRPSPHTQGEDHCADPASRPAAGTFGPAVSRRLPQAWWRRRFTV